MSAKNYFTSMLLSALILVFVSSMAFSSTGNPDGPAKKATLSGKVLDKKTGESLAGALVEVKGTDIKVYTDLDGNYSINDITPGSYTIEVTYISYLTAKMDNIDCSSKAPKSVNVEIQPN